MTVFTSEGRILNGSISGPSKFSLAHVLVLVFVCIHTYLYVLHHPTNLRVKIN